MISSHARPEALDPNCHWDLWSIKNKRKKEMRKWAWAISCSGRRAEVCEWDQAAHFFPELLPWQSEGLPLEHHRARSRGWEFKIKASAGPLFWKISGRGLLTSLSLMPVSPWVSASGFPTPSLCVFLPLPLPPQGHLSFGLGPTRTVILPGSLIASAMTPFQILSVTF